MPMAVICVRRLVQTGATLKANGLIEIEPIAKVSSRLIVNRPALKTRPEEVGGWIERFRDAIGGRPSLPQPFRPGPPPPPVPERGREPTSSPPSPPAGQGDDRS